MITALLIATLLAYLIGSLSMALIVSRLFRLPDPRTQGSGNPGATNILRLYGKIPALCTLLGDMAKGYLPMMLVTHLHYPATLVISVAIATFFGHLFPVFFHFKGGKGVATYLGILCALSPLTGFSWMLTWGVILLLFRYVSLASIVASLSAPFYNWYDMHDIRYVVCLSLLALAIVIRHHKNIQTLWFKLSSSNGQRARTVTGSASRSPRIKRKQPT